MSTSSIPGCLLGVTLEGDSSPHGHASLLQHVLLLEQARQQSTLIAGEWAGSCAREEGQAPLLGLKAGPAGRSSQGFFPALPQLPSVASLIPSTTYSLRVLGSAAPAAMMELTCQSSAVQ